MDSRPLFTVVGSGVKLPPEAFDLLLVYVKHYIASSTLLIADYMKQGGDEEDRVVVDMQRAITQAEKVVQEVEQLRQQAGSIYRWNFVQLAEVLRKVRRHLEIPRIEDMYSTRVVLACVIDMLERENPKFSREKFIGYVNETETV